MTGNQSALRDPAPDRTSPPDPGIASSLDPAGPLVSNHADSFRLYSAPLKKIPAFFNREIHQNEIDIEVSAATRPAVDAPRPVRSPAASSIWRRSVARNARSAHIVSSPPVADHAENNSAPLEHRPPPQRRFHVRDPLPRLPPVRREIILERRFCLYQRSVGAN